MSDHDGMPISGVQTCRHCGLRIVSSQEGWYAPDENLRPSTEGGTGNPWLMYACTENPKGNHPHEPVDVRPIPGVVTPHAFVIYDHANRSYDKCAVCGYPESATVHSQLDVSAVSGDDDLSWDVRDGAAYDRSVAIAIHRRLNDGRLTDEGVLLRFAATRLMDMADQQTEIERLRAEKAELELDVAILERAIRDHRLAHDVGLYPVRPHDSSLWEVLGDE